AGTYAGRLYIYRLFYGVIYQCQFNYASLIWIELAELVEGKDEKKKKAKGPYKPYLRTYWYTRSLLKKQERTQFEKPNNTRTKTTTRKHVKPTRFVPLHDEDEYDELDESLDLVSRDGVKKFVDLDKRDESNK
ncbi:hypothetical protein Tco_0112347, partial [Tanacetum coccineum]